MTLNLSIDPVVAAVRVIDANPKRWDQSVWGRKILETGIDGSEACGTAFCVAGHMVHQSEAFIEDWESGRTLHYAKRTGTQAIVGVEDAAFQVVGLPSYRRAWDLTGVDAQLYDDVRELLNNLFHQDNNRADIQECAQALAAALGQEWPVELPEWAEDEYPNRPYDDSYQDDYYDESEDY